MLPNIEYIKTLVNGLKEFVNNKIKLVKKDIDSLPQADWNQNDPTAKDYVKNRTHYVENGYRQEDYLIHANTSGVSSVEDKEYRNGSIPLVIGEKVQVSFVLGTNGSITYQFAATVVQDANGQEPCIDLKGWPITIYTDHAKYSSYWVNNSGTDYVIVTKNVVSRHVRPMDAEYLANGQEKICWTELELTKLYTNTNADFEPKFGASYFYMTTSPSTDSFGLVAGKKYRVIWDEVPYDCTCVSASRYGRNFSWIGSPTLAAPYNEFGSGNSFPFCISTRRDGTKIENNGAAASRPGKHSFVLYEIGDEIVHKIPDKYISAGSVKYTPQTLDRTQKYQALENISGMPISDSLGEATNIAFVDAVNFNDTTGEAVPNGLLIYKKSFIGGMARYNAIGIDGKTYEIAWNKAGAYLPEIRRVYTGLLDANGHFPQQTMAAAPTEDMQIATKKYADDRAPLIVPVTRNGEYYKFNGDLNDLNTIAHQYESGRQFVIIIDDNNGEGGADLKEFTLANVEMSHQDSFQVSRLIFIASYTKMNVSNPDVIIENIIITAIPTITVERNTASTSLSKIYGILINTPYILNAYQISYGYWYIDGKSIEECYTEIKENPSKYSILRLSGGQYDIKYDDYGPFYLDSITDTEIIYKRTLEDGNWVGFKLSAVDGSPSKNGFIKGVSKEFILASSTADSTKKFKITVNDAGALSAVEVTES